MGSEDIGELRADGPRADDRHALVDILQRHPDGGEHDQRRHGKTDEGDQLSQIHRLVLGYVLKQGRSLRGRERSQAHQRHRHQHQQDEQQAGTPPTRYKPRQDMSGRASSLP